ncbi:MAG TPA: PAS domain-containing protein [Thermodesulforhabdus norvegica]|uniref:PAS domain-containing protein n=1 Tax=Thermodesulforhabdus norvegica TaxID=39841 RepID=A0A7C0WUY4_9BACT|nr:PAS domain-containing protein [Thermodesulforhabdus norvegica]
MTVSKKAIEEGRTSGKSGFIASTDILESISDGVFTVNTDWIVTYFNRAAEEITGLPRSEAVGRKCWEVFKSSMCETECALRETLETGKPIIGKTGYIINVFGEKIPISVSTAVLRNEKGEVVGGAETFRDLSEIEALRKELEGRYRLGDLVSSSPLMHRIFDVLPSIAESPSTVLILGETGTGKEVMARTIHELSPRRQGPFIAVNCGALPDTLLESELFGYKAGAFTGAVKDKPGRIALAEGGTLFLDEIGEVSPALQVRLLRVLQDRTYEPLGSTKTLKADIRVICATNRDLRQMVKEGLFREDLYYRINVVRIELPPLRNRKEDIPLLVEQFIHRFNQIQKKNIRDITPEALSLLMAYDWPGNVRELENVIERAFVLCRDEQIGIEHLPEEITAGSLGHKLGKEVKDIKRAREIFEARVIEEALRRNNYNRAATARELGIDKATLYRKMKKLGIKLP